MRRSIKPIKVGLSDLTIAVAAVQHVSRGWSDISSAASKYGERERGPLPLSWGKCPVDQDPVTFSLPFVKGHLSANGITSWRALYCLAEEEQDRFAWAIERRTLENDELALIACKELYRFQLTGPEDLRAESLETNFWCAIGEYRDREFCQEAIAL